MQKIELDQGAFLSLLEAEAEQLSHYSVGFVIPRSEGDTVVGILGGSGTLVSIDDVEGVLTAEHVVRLLQNRGLAGAILSKHPQEIECVFKLSDCRDFSYSAKPNCPAGGPDLSFLMLPPDVTATLRARKSFYNLSKRCDPMLEHPPSREIGFWAINGIAEEWTTETPSQIGPGRTKVFNGRLLAPLRGMEWRTSGDFDYFSFKPVYNDGYGGPHSFGGYSGGGIWQLIIPRKEGAPTVTDRHLMGVAFYQSDLKVQGEERSREVICHGRESIYRRLVGQVRENMHR